MLVIMAGVSCIGKSSVITHLRDNYSCNALPVYMTRARRENETEKITVSRKEFYEMKDAGDFIYTNEVFGNLYGTPKKESLFASNSNEIWLIDFPIALISAAFYPLIYKAIALIPETEEQLKLQINLGNRQERQEAIFSDYFENYTRNLSDKVDAVVINKFNELDATIREILLHFNKWSEDL